MNKHYMKDTFVTGFALFAMFFGAGNLIFPPYLGWSSASNWFLGFLCFIAIDVGLSMAALLVIAKTEGGVQGVARRLGRRTSTLLLAANVICLGPLIAIPRTAATTFEFGIQPLLPGVSSWVFSILFFLVVILLSIKQSKAIDIIGVVLAPIMLVVLALLIYKGITSPLGVAHGTTAKDTVIRDGILAGYQTMDMMGALIFSLAVTISIRQKGYQTHRQQRRIIASSGVISSLALFAVYCGLAYLGATVSSVYPSTMSQSELLIAITSGLLGRSGIVLLGVIVATACLTTAIGLISSAASFFTELTKGRIKYPVFVLVFALFSCIISNYGISTIIAFASPILELLYPVLVVLIALGFFNEHIKNDNIFKFAAAGAFLTAAATQVQTLFGVNLGLSRLPLSDYGFGWLLPAMILGIIGSFIKPRKTKASDKDYHAEAASLADM